MNDGRVTDAQWKAAQAIVDAAFDEANAIVLDDLEAQDEWERSGRNHLDFTPHGEDVLVRMVAQQIAKTEAAEVRVEELEAVVRDYIKAAVYATTPISDSWGVTLEQKRQAVLALLDATGGNDG